MHKRVAEMLLRDPTVVALAFQVVNRWREAGSVAPLYVEYWRRILELPPAEIAKELCDEGETATMLRQVSPFVGALSPRERWRLLREERATREPS